MASIVRVELYKNAVRVRRYILGTLTDDNIIKIRWYQRGRARNIIDMFYLFHITEFYSQGIEWQYEDASKVMRWDFQSNQPK